MSLKQQLEDLQRKILALQNEFPDSPLQPELQRVQREIRALEPVLPRRRPRLLIVQPTPPPDVPMTAGEQAVLASILRLHQGFLQYAGWVNRQEWLGWADVAADASAAISGGTMAFVEEAPFTGTIYGRQNGLWVPVPSGTNLPPPPATGGPYAWNADTQSWVVIGSGGTIGVSSVTAGTGLSGGTITSTGTIGLTNTAVTPGAYNSANITVDAQGRIQNANHGQGGGGVSSITAGNGLTGGTITSTGTIALASPVAIANGGTGATTLAGAQANLGIGSGGVTFPITIAQGGTGATTLAQAQTNLGIGPGGAVGTPAWNWNQLYIDPVGYTARVLAPGFASELPIAAGAWPVGYMISDGVTPGGVPASGTNNGTQLIRIQPPISGVGRLKFIVECKVTVVNNAPSTGSFVMALGVSHNNGPNKPMYPYLGVAHEQATLQHKALSIQPGESMTFTCARLDIMDNAFQSDQPIPNWPNWTLQLSTDGSLLYPAVDLEFGNTGSVALLVTDVFLYGFAC